MAEQKRQRREPDTDSISLAGLDPEEALRALLNVDPESEPVEPCRRQTPEGDQREPEGSGYSDGQR